MAPLFIAGAVVAVAAWRALAPAAVADPEPDTAPTALETLQISMDPTTYQTGTLPGDLAAQNMGAWLSMLKVSEGTAGIGDDGYNVLYGSTPSAPILFDSYADHPRQRITANGITSSAAGAFQIIRATYDSTAPALGITDFSPASQRAIALELTRRRGALEDVRAGRFADACYKCRKEWASLPGANYPGQHMQKLDTLQAAFEAAGGTVTA